MTEASADPLVERDRELAIIEAALDRARTGAGGVVLVEGVAGLGKSRLLREAAALAYRTGMRTLRGRGAEAEREFAFGLALQLFEPVLEGPAADRAALRSEARSARQRLLGHRGRCRRPWRRSG
jgi:predicted ATPase